MKNHAAIVSSLVNGKVRVFTNEIQNENFAKFFTKENERTVFFLFHQQWCSKFSNDKGIILCD